MCMVLIWGNLQDDLRGHDKLIIRTLFEHVGSNDFHVNEQQEFNDCIMVIMYQFGDYILHEVTEKEKINKIKE